jgi:hypothetical protein
MSQILELDKDNTEDDEDDDAEFDDNLEASENPIPEAALRYPTEEDGAPKVSEDDELCVCMYVCTYILI